MAFYWVQQWVALPVIFEYQMGDVPPESGNGPDDNQQPLRPIAGGGGPTSPPFNSQYTNLPQPQLHSLNIPRGAPQATQQYGHQPHDIGSSFNLSSMAGALPQFAAPVNRGYPQQQSQGPISGASPSAIAYDLQQITQYPGQPQPPYNAGPILQGQYPNTFVQTQLSQSGPFNAYGQGQPRSFGNYQQQAQQMSYYYPQQYAAQPSVNPLQHYQGEQNRRSSLPSGQTGFLTLNFSSESHNTYSAMNPILGSRSSSDSNVSSVPRGPPRKPKQSGHALWIGNLPPGTTVLDLKDHFSREATRDIESLFLISKSNCAFVNYRTEASCTAAMHRFHDSRFHGVRLVCRLRRSSTPSSGVPTGPAAMADGRTAASIVSPTEEALEDLNEHSEFETEGLVIVGEADVNREAPSKKVPEKFFVVKSLTMQDLEQSVRNGIWATQSHNEEALNKAFETAENVYLIFSANKSGEYFGYARMASAISEDPSELLSSVPRPNFVEPSDAPRSIPTPATEFAPKGRIIDDSARGTIFWEAELSDSGNEEQDEVEENSGRLADGEIQGIDQSWGKPFKIEWVSTNRLPFFKTRGLRNPWNANREVKIARDGTELETSIGKRLIQLFPRGNPPNVLPLLQGPIQGQHPY